MDELKEKYERKIEGKNTEVLNAQIDYLRLESTCESLKKQIEQLMNDLDGAKRENAELSSKLNNALGIKIKRLLKFCK